MEDEILKAECRYEGKYPCRTVKHTTSLPLPRYCRLPGRDVYCGTE